MSSFSAQHSLGLPIYHKHPHQKATFAQEFGMSPGYVVIVRTCNVRPLGLG